MSRQVLIRSQAEVDISEAAHWYDQQREGLGDEFISEVQKAIENAAAHPRHYRCLRRRPEVRRVLTDRFPYRIFYILRRDAIVVFRVLHGARHDREWRGNV